jgi:hypothetical protein
VAERHHRVYPGVESQCKRFEELKSGNDTAWRDLTLQEIEAAGEHELLNWIPLAGVMDEIGQHPTYGDCIASYLMNSCKCVAIFPPNEAMIGA